MAAARSSIAVKGSPINQFGKSKQSYFTCVTASPIPNPSTWLKISFQTTMRDILPGRAFNPAGADRPSKPDHTRPADFREKGRDMDQLANQSKSKPLASVTFLQEGNNFFVYTRSVSNQPLAQGASKWTRLFPYGSRSQTQYLALQEFSSERPSHILPRKVPVEPIESAC